MSEVTKEKYDLETLAIKQKLIGCKIHFEDGVSDPITDWYKDNATNELHVVYADGTGANLDLRLKYVVTIPGTYLTVQPQKKRKRKKNI